VCTLSFVPKNAGYLVAMNRDELLTRGSAHPPATHEPGGTKAIFPTDVEGGTWIAATERGDTWALLNRNGGRRSAKNVSRGRVVLGAVAAPDFTSITGILEEAGLFNFLPFRLIGVSAVLRQVQEWVWDGQALSVLDHPWGPRQWFSSGLSDTKAAEIRGEIFKAGRLSANAGTVNWLRRMHASHDPAPGAFSVCVHRDDAATVSYTEIEVSQGTVEMRYHPGSPCIEASFQEIQLPLRRTASSQHSQ
jgi:hypothetical protein